MGHSETEQNFSKIFSKMMMNFYIKFFTCYINLKYTYKNKTHFYKLLN